MEFLKNTLVKDIMTTPVHTVNEESDFYKVQEMFSLYDIRHIPVTDKHGRIVGLITQRDLYKIHSPRRLEDGTWYYDKDVLNEFILKNVMLHDVITLKPTHTLRNVIEMMLSFKIGCIPVVDVNNTVIGIVSRVDILKFLLK